MKFITARDGRANTETHTYRLMYDIHNTFIQQKTISCSRKRWAQIYTRNWISSINESVSGDSSMHTLMPSAWISGAEINSTADVSPSPPALNDE